MVLEIFTNPSTTDILMLTVLFLLFVMAIKKIMGIVTNMIMVSVACVVLPILAERIVGLPIPTDTHSLITYVMGGIGAYFVYLIAQQAAKFFKGASKVTKKILPKRPKEKVRIIEKEHIHVHDEAPKRFVQKQKSVEQHYKNYVVIEDNPPAAQPQKKKSVAEPLPDISKRKKKE